jgi:uncharacterized membrane protein YidH (DUF202 family)
MRRSFWRRATRPAATSQSAPDHNRSDGSTTYSVAQAEERTDLAWVRSALAFGGVGVAMIKGLKTFGPAKPVDGVAILVLAAAVLLLAGGYLIRRRGEQSASHRSLLLVSTGAVAVGLIAIVIGSTS